MKLLFDFFPILLFFIAYKFAGIYVATAIAIITSFVQVAYHFIRYRRFENMQLLTLVLIAVLGGATIWLHDEMFIKWKPTVINWVLAILFFTSHWIGKQPLIKRLMQDHVELPNTVWRRLNFSWIGFFFLTGLANLYVVYNFDTDTWVNFKLFGILGLTLIFVILQSIYLAKHIKHEPNTH
jgi:intracellular septation protein